MKVLGIETSCDETGVALFNSATREIVHAVHSQIDLHRDYGGVVPELASRDHIRRVLPLVEDVLARAHARRSDIDAIAVTAGPGLIGALLVGCSIGSALGYALGRPVVGVHHMEGHLLSPLLAEPAPQFPFVALLVSGGHTQLLQVERIGSYRLLGETLDDAAGEAFDKAAQLLGLGYPGGPAVSRLAQFGTHGAVTLPRPLLHSDSLDFSFSGLKTAVRNAVRQATNLCDQVRADIALGFVEAAVDVLTAKSLKALRQCGSTRLVVSGGVSANSQLRERLLTEAERVGAEVFFPPPALCTDNGAMIALAGWAALERGVGVAAAGQVPAIEVRPRWPLESIGVAASG
ncbi:MAG: tRNA (adenosine(37)-N6)-threonylcarbamoyltransferase complex transferase subunit TsaD [Burkholderiaceae bacterium]|nr:tRNA (adenosine(37)-N6)-threonylcarbamoyltransferase complex transferase subunit TsaD [Burkholderiaceae bacterium]